MDTRKSRNTGSNDDTLVVSSSPTPADSAPPVRCVHMVDGSGPQFSGEVGDVLRYRLRLASFLLSAGFCVFLVWHTLLVSFAKPLNIAFYAAHFAVTLLTAVAGMSLCHRCTKSHARLRGMEYFTFGVSAAFFVFYQYVRSTYDAGHLGNVPSGNAGWSLLLLTYALLIPNTWRRALPLLSVFSFTPVVVTFALWTSQNAAANVMANDYALLTETVLTAILSFAIALVGVHSINVLRTEAFEAKQVGQYRLKRLIGRGGMGEVYLAEHRMMKRPCAIKIIHPDKTGDMVNLARFEREVRATAKLSHWNTIDIYDYGRTDQGTFYYVMEYLPGLNLHELVAKFGPMPAERVIYLMRQACDALSEAHKIGLVHRDIKPANMFSATRGGHHDVMKLLDFGLAKPTRMSDDANLTQDGAITGSPLYMSPEQAIGETEPDARGDVYSLGAVMYYLLAGVPPFPYDKPIKVILAHAKDAPRRPTEIVSSIPADLEEIVLRCLEKNPDDRFQDAEHLGMALSRCAASDRWTREDSAQWWERHATNPPQAGISASSVSSPELAKNVE